MDTQFKRGRVRRPGKIAKMLGLSTKKVNIFFDEGNLGGYRLPIGRAERRIFENSALEFLARKGYDFELQTFDNGKVDVVMPQGFLTVGKVAELLSVSHVTVINYFEREIFHGYVLDNGDRRICKRSVAKYLQGRNLDSIDPKILAKYNLPLEPSEGKVA